MRLARGEQMSSRRDPATLSLSIRGTGRLILLPLPLDQDDATRSYLGSRVQIQ